MAKWTISEEDDTWRILRNGRFKTVRNSVSARNKWLKSRCATGDSIILKHSDGFLEDVTKKIL